MKNKKKSILDFDLLYILIAIIVGFIIGAIFLAIVGLSPAEVYGKLFDSVFSKPKYMVWTLMYAAPIMMPKHAHASIMTFRFVLFFLFMMCLVFKRWRKGTIKKC